MPRIVTLVVLDASGTVLGALPPVPVAQPWWMSTSDITAAARERFGLEVTVLRLISAELPRHPGGRVSYAVQVTGGPSDVSGLLSPAAPDLVAAATAQHPLRADYARPGGPQATLAWAQRALAAAGRDPVVGVRQQRTWNLSAIWRLETASGPVWVKQVPPFFGHEPAVLAWLAGNGHRDRVPRLIARDGRRMLLEHVPGGDLYNARAEIRLAIAAEMHAIHTGVDIGALSRAGVPDRRHLGPWLAEVGLRYAGGDDGVRHLVGELDRRLARVAACRMPATLMHGDLHAGNVLGTADGKLVILDWGDCVIGHPAFDILRLTDGLPRHDAEAICHDWARWWRTVVPGCDPLGAVELLRPVAALYAAASYDGFLARIEPSEHPYHRQDVTDSLARAVELASARG